MPPPPGRGSCAKLTSPEGLHTPRLHNRTALPNPRRPPQSLADLGLHNPQGPLRRSHRRQIFLSGHPRYSRRPFESSPDKYTQAKNHRRRGQALRAPVHGKQRQLRVQSTSFGETEVEDGEACEKRGGETGRARQRRGRCAKRDTGNAGIAMISCRGGVKYIPPPLSHDRYTHRYAECDFTIVPSARRFSRHVRIYLVSNVIPLTGRRLLQVGL